MSGSNKLWRLLLKPAQEIGVNSQDVFDYCIKNDIACIGWPLLQEPSPTFSSFDEYYRLALEYGDSNGTQSRHYKPQSLSNVTRFAKECSIGDFIWITNKQAKYYVGKVIGDWIYNYSAAENHCANQRSCVWEKIELQEVPGTIKSAFSGVGQTFRRINSEIALRHSGFLHNKENIPHTANANEFFEINDPSDIEDIVGLYLQYERGYVLIPSSCKRRDTRAYEFELRHKKDGHTAIIQTKKKGNIEAGKLAGLAIKVYVLTYGKILKPAENIEPLSHEDLYVFCKKHPHLFPSRIATQLNLKATSE